MVLFVFHQALLRGSFTQQSATTLIILAVDRYIAAVHPVSYNKIFSKKVIQSYYAVPKNCEDRNSERLPQILARTT